MGQLSCQLSGAYKIVLDFFIPDRSDLILSETLLEFGSVATTCDREIVGMIPRDYTIEHDRRQHAHTHLSPSPREQFGSRYKVGSKQAHHATDQPHMSIILQLWLQTKESEISTLIWGQLRKYFAFSVDVLPKLLHNNKCSYSLFISWILHINRQSYP